MLGGKICLRKLLWKCYDPHVKWQSIKNVLEWLYYCLLYIHIFVLWEISVQLGLQWKCFLYLIGCVCRQNSILFVVIILFVAHISEFMDEIPALILLYIISSNFSLRQYFSCRKLFLYPDYTEKSPCYAILLIILLPYTRGNDGSEKEKNQQHTTKPNNKILGLFCIAVWGNITCCRILFHDFEIQV